MVAAEGLPEKCSFWDEHCQTSPRLYPKTGPLSLYKIPIRPVQPRHWMSSPSPLCTYTNITCGFCCCSFLVIPLCWSKMCHSLGMPVNSPVCGLKPTCVTWTMLYGEDILAFPLPLCCDLACELLTDDADEFPCTVHKSTPQFSKKISWKPYYSNLPLTLPTTFPSMPFKVDPLLWATMGDGVAFVSEDVEDELNAVIFLWLLLLLLLPL